MRKGCRCPLCYSNIISNPKCIAITILLVLRRRVSAKRRTIVFSTVRPSLQQIIELSNKFQVFYTFDGIIRPMNHVRLSKPRCTTLYGRVLAYPSMDFVFLLHMERAYIGALLRRINFEKSKNLEFRRFFFKWRFWGLGTLKMINRI